MAAAAAPQACKAASLRVGQCQERAEVRRLRHLQGADHDELHTVHLRGERCSSGQVCVASACQAPSDLLGACDEAADCAKGDCVNKMCGLYIKSVRVTGSAVAGGAGQIMTDGWFKTDSAGHNKERVSTIPQLNLHDSIDMSSTLTTPLPPNNYLVLTGVLGSNALTRTFQFNLSDGSSITKTVQASNAQEILLSEGTGDAFMLFQWTGATVNVLPKTY